MLVVVIVKVKVILILQGVYSFPYILSWPAVCLLFSNRGEEGNGGSIALMIGRADVRQGSKTKTSVQANTAYGATIPGHE